MKNLPDIPDVSELSAKQRRALLKQLLQAKAQTDHGLLSYGQRALWFMSSLAPGSAAYNWVFRAVIRSEVDVSILRETFLRLIDRHEQLRSVVSVRGGVPVRDTIPPGDEVFQRVDAGSYSDRELEEAVRREIRRPFVLDRGPLVRVRVMSRSNREHVLLIVTHHMVMDARSLEILLDDASDVYASLRMDVEPTLPPRGSTYLDYVRWQEATLASEHGARLRRYWLDELAGELPVLELPTARARPARRSFRGDAHSFSIDASAAADARRLAREERTTLFVIVMAAFQAFLSRYTGQSEVLVGTPMAGRTRPEFERVVGYFVNPVVIRGDLSHHPTYRELIHQMRGKVIEAVAHQDYPFPILVEQLQPRRDPSHSPIFQAMIDWHVLRSPKGDRSRPSALGGLDLEPVIAPQQEGQFDVSLDVFESNDALTCALKYDTDLIDAETAARMARHFVTLLTSALDNPDRRVSQLKLLTDDERRRVTIEWNDTAADYPREYCIHYLFEQQAKATPSRIAARHRSRAMSYQELDARASAVAARLRARGVVPDTPVGICSEPSLELLVGLIGILKSGGAYLPLDPGYPRERLLHMVEDSGAHIVLSGQGCFVELSRSVETLPLVWDEHDREDAVSEPARPDPPVRADNLAYVIYTSGSTGKPKGVQVPHRSVVNLLHSMSRRPGIRAHDVLLAVTTISFDIHVLELFLPLMVGARVHLVDRELLRDGRRLLGEIRRSGATLMQATPSGWRLLADAGWNEKLDLKILCGGEPLSRQLAEELLALGKDVWNMYGPTETTVWSATHQVQAGDESIPIGRPIDNTQFYILDTALEPVPIGVLGELYIGGDGVTRGYVNLPDLTSERFVADPFSGREGERLYATGDVARYRSDGVVEVHGRKDDQVKLRGFRIEMGEVEAVLRSHEAVGDAVATVRGDDRDRRLIGYLVPAADAHPTPAEIRSFLKNRLPDYMVPSEILWLAEFPKAPNGKIDRLKLPLPPREIETFDPAEAPSTPMEIALAEIWQDVLEVDGIGIYDNFFDLGGHSLLSMKVADMVSKTTGHGMDPQELVNQTLRQVAAKLDRRREPAASRNRPGLKERLRRAFRGARSSDG